MFQIGLKVENSIFCSLGFIGAFLILCMSCQVKLEVPTFDLSDDMAANLANEELTAQVEELCTVWNKQIMDALDGLLKKTPEGVC